MLQLHLAIFLFGLAGLFAKFLTIPATGIVFGRTVIATGVLLVLLRTRSGRFSPHFLREGLRLLPAGALLALHWLTFFHSIQISSVATGLLAVSTFPVFVVLLDPIFNQRKPAVVELLCAAVVCAGLMLVVPAYDFGNTFFQGVLWGLISALTFALLTFFNQRFVAKMEPLAIGLYQNFWAAVCLVPFAGQLKHLDLNGWLLIIFLAIFCTAMAHTLFIAALKVVKPQLASIAAGLEPVYGIVLATLFLGEYPGWRELCGGALIVSAVVAASCVRESSASAHNAAK